MVVAAGCGGSGTETPTEPQVYATSTEVAQIIEDNEPYLSRLPVTYSCVSKDVEGRTFSCIAELTAQEGIPPVTVASYDVVCDGIRCQWEKYTNG